MRRLALLAAAISACWRPAPIPPSEPITASPPPAPTGNPVRERPSVILIVVDTLRADHLSPWGHARDTSPALTKLAAGAVRYARAHAAAPWTKPSIAAILTSNYPSQLGLTDKSAAIPAKARLLSESFSEAGYRTGAVISHTYLGSRYGFNQGYDTFNERNVEGEMSSPSRGVTDDALAFIDEHAPQGPFFLLVHYFDPHFAYLKREGFPFSEEEGYKGPIQSGIPYGKMRELVEHLNPADVDELLRLYDTEIAATDRALGRLFDRVLQDPALSDTMIVVTADHGEEFLDHGRWGHTTRLYQELIHVPLIIRFPDGRAGVVEQPVSNIDILPTVLSAVHLPIPKMAQGLNLADPVPADHPVFAETASDFRKDAIVVGNRKLVFDRDEHNWQLFDLGADPGEQKNLFDHRRAEAAALRDQLEAWQARVREGKTLKGAEVKLSKDERQALERLGYVDP
jgi:arylsulfatase A-like enzyme